ncbi:hypothetical protein WJ78_08640 [Burkholderia ubonensis]|uniref:WD40 repeat domain-containing protein n=1 Tax=Burkholderia ubonensis TaxID=101571 RepID=UPI000755901B|nr:WD40 repeat domain-containing protein [Burkholderia ubonensis]KVD78224.1 hypothetical protein WI88_22415 [Burkholderia ubonensis]KVO70815.1 hypothetical protein WJ78_08640 [Burkholderia ubonensis]KWO80931.1 hypothetical protein WM32_26405 [Burkholderia ubonensis]
MLGPGREALTPDNPWPGLDPFDETDHAYFFGRTVESRELYRLVQRENLTVLLGRSGLGKTSLLKAGLFPLLRNHDYLPVYVRLDHAENAPPLTEQVFRALQTECEAFHVHATQPVVDESLWSFFHRRDVEFWSARNRPVTPVIVLDQFEEIFTSGLDADGSRNRLVQFVASLGNLVENHPPETVTLALEADPSCAGRFEFKRSRAKLLLSFREDFLAEVEGLKEQIPSLMYNRFRLLAMDGAQAYRVITEAGGRLVDDESARSIIRLAWQNTAAPPVDRSEFEHIEIDPALLSVVCSELNRKRRESRPPRESITFDLIEHADREILSGFYARSMDGCDPHLRSFVEDELITDRGYRDSYDFEDALALPGVSAQGLEQLVRRRLLRIDERRGVRRIELTHDVLTRVVKDSRDNRRASEAEQAAHAREQAALAQQRANQRNAFFVFVGALSAAVLIVVSAIFAWESYSLRAHARHDALIASADKLESRQYDTSLLLHREALQISKNRSDAMAFIPRFLRQPYISAYLHGHQKPVFSVAFIDDGKTLASGSYDGSVMLWDVEQHKPIAKISGHGEEVYGIAFRPHARQLASANADGTVTLWDVDRHTSVTVFRGHEGIVTSVAFSPDGKLLASGGADRSIMIWSVESGRPVATLDGHTDTVTGVAFSPDGKRVASSSWDGTVAIWALSDNRRQLSLPVHIGKVLSVAFSPDGKYLATSGANGSVIVLNTDGHASVRSLVGHTAAVYAVSFSRDGRRIVSASADRSLIVWDRLTGTPAATLKGHSAKIFSAAFSPDGKRLASAGADKSVILWELPDTRFAAPLQSLEGSVMSLAFSANGKHLVSSGSDNAINIWDVETGKRVATLPRLHKKLVSSIAVSPDGKLLASGSWDGTVALWDIDHATPLKSFDASSGRVSGVAFSHDGQFVAGASENAVTIWDVNAHSPPATLLIRTGPYFSVAFSPDGMKLAIASAKHGVLLWDINSRRQIAILEKHGSAISSVAFSRDGTRLASSSWDGTVCLWNMTDNTLLATLEAHTEPVLGVAFSPDGTQLASVGWDKKVIVWDLEGKTPVATVLEGNDERLQSVAFSPDGIHVASGGLDSKIMLWRVDPADAAAEACRIANRNLSCDEWKRYVRTGGYHKTCVSLPAPEKCDQMSGTTPFFDVP